MPCISHTMPWNSYTVPWNSYTVPWNLNYKAATISVKIQILKSLQRGLN